MKTNALCLALVALLVMPWSYAEEKIHFAHGTIAQALQQISTPARQDQSARFTDDPQEQIKRKQTMLDEAFGFQTQHFSQGTRQTHTRYQQHYHGIPVLGGNITIHSQGKPIVTPQQSTPRFSQHPKQSLVSGYFIDGITLDPHTLEAANQPSARDQAWQMTLSQLALTSTQSQLAQEHPHSTKLVLGLSDNESKLMYHISFYLYASPDKQMALINMLVDAQNPAQIYALWDNLQHGSKHDTGLGGNTKTKPYTYGLEGLPALHVKTKSQSCLLENEAIKVVNALEKPRSISYDKAYKYTCGDEIKDKYEFCTTQPWWLNSEMDHSTQDTLALPQPICFTAYSAANDAYHFGQVTHDLFKTWYNTDLLSEQLVLRVHVGTVIKDGRTYNTLDNAYWDPVRKTMNFGDGYFDKRYPLVSLDITAHEVAHGFTQEHADLTYRNQMGAVNESFSDMAAMAALSYLREHENALYQKIYHQNNMLWMIGPTISITPYDNDLFMTEPPTDEEIASSYDVPIRFMEKPSNDGRSADCYAQVDGCHITYHDVVDNAYATAKELAPDECFYLEESRCIDLIAQGRIVHQASGVFNKAFYILANKDGWSIRKAFAVMLTANRDGYWTDNPLGNNNYFNETACATLQATKALGYEVDDVKAAFQAVGLLLDNNSQDSGNQHCPLA